MHARSCWSPIVTQERQDRRENGIRRSLVLAGTEMYGTDEDEAFRRGRQRALRMKYHEWRDGFLAKDERYPNAYREGYQWQVRHCPREFKKREKPADESEPETVGT